MEEPLLVPLPAPLPSCMDAFVTFYAQKHAERKLTWLLTACRADVIMHGWDEPYEVRVAPAQLSLLLAFQVVDQVTVKGLGRVLGGWARDEVLRLVDTFADLGLFRVSVDQATVRINPAFSR
jgi:hypothetical protein